MQREQGKKESFKASRRNGIDRELPLTRAKAAASTRAETGEASVRTAKDSESRTQTASSQQAAAGEKEKVDERAAAEAVGGIEKVRYL